MTTDDRTYRVPGTSPSTSSSGEWRRRAFPGARVGDYVLEDLLGQGGMASVWIARHARSGERYAMKLLALEDESELAVARFRREGEAMARIAPHLHVLRVHSAGEHDGQAYLVLELARGGDLKRRLRAGPLEPTEAARLVAALARGLAHVHAHGVLHRDLKPANIVFDEQGTPKLMDFGLARLAGAEKLTKTGAVLGTPAYMAPEQAGGDPVDARTDVYALGAVLYDCLAGGPPFTGESVHAIVRKVLLLEPTPPSDVREGVPADLERICLRALAKKKARRYQTALELAEDLERFLRGEPVSAPRRPSGALALVAAGGLVALLGGVAAVAATEGAGEGPAGPAAVSTQVVHRRSTTAAATELLVPPRRAGERDPLLASWTVLGHDVTTQEVVVTWSGARRVRLRVEALDGPTTVAAPTRTVLLDREVSAPRERHEVPLAVGWTAVRLLALDGTILERRDLVRLPERLQLVEGLEVRATIDGSSLRLVPPGELVRAPPALLRDQAPRVDLALPYFLGTYEVDWAQWRAFCAETRRPAVTPQQAADREPPYPDGAPVTYVHYGDLYASCDWAELRLPSDVEWQWAAQGQVESLNQATRVTRGPVPARDRTVVDARARFGHRHLLGNVFEWVQSVDFGDPRAPSMRRPGDFGGDFDKPPEQITLEPTFDDPTNRMRDTGFRVARNVGAAVGEQHRFPE